MFLIVLPNETDIALLRSSSSCVVVVVVVGAFAVGAFCGFFNPPKIVWCADVLQGSYAAYIIGYREHSLKYTFRVEILAS